MRLRRVLLAPLLALLLPLLADLLARLRALLWRHLLPPLPVARDALALFRRQLLPHLEALHDALATLGGQALEALVRLLQLLAARLGQLVPALQILKDALLRSELLPLAIALEDVLPLLGRHLLPALEIALGDGALLGREAVHALDRRRLAEGDLQHAAREQHGGGEDEGHPAHQHGHFTPPWVGGRSEERRVGKECATLCR